MSVLLYVIYTTIKTTSEFRNVSVTVGVVDGLVLHGLALHGGRGQRHGAERKADLNRKL